MKASEGLAPERTVLVNVSLGDSCSPQAMRRSVNRLVGPVCPSEQILQLKGTKESVTGFWGGPICGRAVVSKRPLFFS